MKLNTIVHYKVYNTMVSIGFISMLLFGYTGFNRHDSINLLALNTGKNFVVTKICEHSVDLNTQLSASVISDRNKG